MDDVYNNIDDHNPNRKTKNLIVFDDIIASIMADKKFQNIIKQCRKLNIFLIFTPQSYFSVPKEVRLNSANYLIMKIHNIKEFQNIATNHSADTEYKGFLKIYKKYTSESYSFLTINTTLPGDDSLRFWKNLLDSL